MKTLLAALILLSSMTAMAADKVVNCTKKSNVNHTLVMTYEIPTLKIKTVTITNPNPETEEMESKTIRPLGQMPWQNFAFLVSLPMGRNMIVPFSVFTQSPSSEVILDSSIQYKCK